MKFVLDSVVLAATGLDYQYPSISRKFPECFNEPNVINYQFFCRTKNTCQCFSG